MNLTSMFEKIGLSLPSRITLFYVVSKFTLNVFVSYCLILIPAYILSTKFAVLSWEYLSLGAKVIAMYWLFKAIPLYRRLRSVSELREFINEIRDNINSLNYHYLDTKRRAEETKYKIDLLKAFSPVPLIVFILTLILGEDFSLIKGFQGLESWNPVEIPETFAIFAPETFAILVAVFLVIYTVSIYNSYIYFKKINRMKYTFQIALEKAKYLKENPPIPSELEVVRTKK